MKMLSLVSVFLFLTMTQAQAASTPTTPSRCYLGQHEGSLVFVQNELGERRYRHETGPGLDLLVSAVETGFCTLDVDTKCGYKERQITLSADCTPNQGQRVTLFAGGIIVFMESSKSVCNWPAGPKESGKDNFRELANSARKTLARICTVTDR